MNFLSVEPRASYAFVSTGEILRAPVCFTCLWPVQLRPMRWPFLQSSCYMCNLHAESVVADLFRTLAYPYINRMLSTGFLALPSELPATTASSPNVLLIPTLTRAYRRRVLHFLPQWRLQAIEYDTSEDIDPIPVSLQERFFERVKQVRLYGWPEDISQEQTCYVTLNGSEFQQQQQEQKADAKDSVVETPYVVMSEDLQVPEADTVRLWCEAGIPLWCFPSVSCARKLRIRLVYTWSPESLQDYPEDPILHPTPPLDSHVVFHIEDHKQQPLKIQYQPEHRMMEVKDDTLYFTSAFVSTPATLAAVQRYVQQVSTWLTCFQVLSVSSL